MTTLPPSQRDALPDPGRDEARLHIEEHALGEAERIAKLSRVRELVLGFQDGLLVPLGVVTGMAAANPGRPAILVAGLAEAVAGCIAMGGDDDAGDHLDAQHGAAGELGKGRGGQGQDEVLGACRYR